MSCDVQYIFIFKQWCWVWFDSVHMTETHILKELSQWIFIASEPTVTVTAYESCAWEMNSDGETSFPVIYYSTNCHLTRNIVRITMSCHVVMFGARI